MVNDKTESKAHENECDYSNEKQNMVKVTVHAPKDITILMANDFANGLLEQGLIDDSIARQFLDKVKNTKIADSKKNDIVFYHETPRTSRANLLARKKSIPIQSGDQITCKNGLVFTVKEVNKHKGHGATRVVGRFPDGIEITVSLDNYRRRTVKHPGIDSQYRGLYSGFELSGRAGEIAEQKALKCKCVYCNQEGPYTWKMMENHFMQNHMDMIDTYNETVHQTRYMEYI